MVELVLTLWISTSKLILDLAPSGTDPSGKAIGLNRKYRKDMKDMNIDFTKISKVVLEDIMYCDAPDFVDAYISEANINNRPATDKELDAINQNQDFVYDSINNYLY